MLYGLFIVILLVIATAFFALSEISLAASRRIKLRAIADSGDHRAKNIIDYQDHPGLFITTIQIGINALAILSGIVGGAFFTEPLAAILPDILSPEIRLKIASTISFILITIFFVLFGDLVPKRVAMALPESVALRLVPIMSRVIMVCGVLAKALNALGDVMCRLLGVPDKRQDDITSDDLYAVMEAGTMAGLLRKQEKDIIGNVFELDTRAVPSAMTVRNDIVYFDLHESEEEIKDKIANSPHTTYIVCKDDIDHIVGYVDSKELLERVIKGQKLRLDEGMEIRPPLIIPDTLTLAEAMDQFKGKDEDLAIVLNEYALVVGLITLQDIMMMLMGNLVGEEEQIIKRDENSWLVEGATPIDDIMHVFNIDEFPDPGNYETLSGFMTYILRRIPHRTDSVVYGGYKFEVMDVDSYKIDQVLVTKQRVPEQSKGRP